MTETRLETLRLLLDVKPPRSYDEHQMAVTLVTWLCCKRTVWTTDPSRGCLLCRLAKA